MLPLGRANVLPNRAANLMPDLITSSARARMPRWSLSSRGSGSVMLEADKYSAFETLRDGRQVEIRAIRSDDRTDLVAAVARTSAESLRRRFFVVKRYFTDQETDFFLNVDFVDHVALVAVAQEGDHR
jgi:hypothetical protein